MPAPPKEPCLELKCPASPETKSEGLTHDSFAVISCDYEKDGVSYNDTKEDPESLLADIACKYIRYLVDSVVSHASFSHNSR